MPATMTMPSIIWKPSILLHLFGALVIVPALGLRCFNCASETNSACSSSNIEILGEYLVDCRGMANATQCVKTVGTTGKITRSCSIPVSAEPGCTSVESLTVCSCDTDTCNDSTRLASLGFSLTVIFALSAGCGL